MKLDKMERAHRLWLDTGGAIRITTLANEVGVSRSTVYNWISNGWKLKQPRISGNQNAKGNRGGRGGPIGNQHSKGHGAKVGNTNAVTTGEYESISYDTLNDAEREYFDTVKLDPLTLIDEQIKILAIREKRMLERIEGLKRMQEIAETEDFISKTYSGEELKPGVTTRTTTKRTKLLIDKLVMVEEALTRVQEKLIKAIETRQRLAKEMEQKGDSDNKTIVFNFNREGEPK